MPVESTSLNSRGGWMYVGYIVELGNDVSKQGHWKIPNYHGTRISGVSGSYVGFSATIMHDQLLQAESGMSVGLDIDGSIWEAVLSKSNLLAICLIFHVAFCQSHEYWTYRLPAGCRPARRADGTVCEGDDPRDGGNCQMVYKSDEIDSISLISGRFLTILRGLGRPMGVGTHTLADGSRRDKSLIAGKPP